MPRRNYLFILAMAVGSLVCYRATDHNRYGRYFSEVMNRIDQYYVKRVDNEALFEAAVNGMLQTLDENSKFYEPEDANSKLLSVIDQRYGGVGIEVSEDPKTEQIVVKDTIVGSPAYAADILAGDRITRIDNRVVNTDGAGIADLTLEEATRLIRGPIDTLVHLELARAGHAEPVKVTLERTLVKVESVLGDSRNADDRWNFRLSGHPEIGYIRIHAFGDRTADELQQALAAIDADKLKGLVLDLRGDPGGRLDVAVDVCSLFVAPEQTVVTTRGRDARELEKMVSHGPAICTDVPMVVLIDGFSASASEIVAACLQDYHRAVICGQRSFGKGTVQRIIPVNGNNSVLKLTTATYWRPSNKNIHRYKDAKDTDEWGVVPDKGFAVKMSEKQTEDWLMSRAARDIVHRARPPVAKLDRPRPDAPAAIDPQLQRALDYLDSNKSDEASPRAKKAAA
jgi:carboxyl-terminal processing protease